MNNCKWLMVGATSPCNKLSKKQYCEPHMQSVRRGSLGPQPRLMCGIGVKGKSQICANCGNKKYRELKRYCDVFTHINHRAVVIKSPQDYVNKINNNLDK